MSKLRHKRGGKAGFKPAFLAPNLTFLPSTHVQIKPLDMMQTFNSLQKGAMVTVIAIERAALQNTAQISY